VDEESMLHNWWKDGNGEECFVSYWVRADEISGHGAEVKTLEVPSVAT
jgi:hypothetical protein